MIGNVTHAAVGTVEPRPRALARCEWCAWRALHTADTMDEAREFIRERLVAHILTQHADQVERARPS